MAVGNPISLTDNVASRIVSQTATESQTNFDISGGYRINAISVYRNGVRLANGRDYSAVDGSVVVLSSPSVEYDVLEFHIFDDFRVADAIVSNAAHQNIEGNLTITGILTASNFSFTTLQLDSLTVTNDVSIGGTLTYQDVKNVDSVGVITARTDIHVGAGLSVVGVSTFNGNAIFNGNVNLGNASSDTITVAGKFDGDLIPSADDQKDLGSSTLEWKNLYLDGTANIDTLSVSGNSILTGSVGIGLTNPAAELHTIGDVIIQGDGGTGERSLFIGKHATITPKTRGIAVVANQTAAEHHEMILKTSTSSSGLVEQVRITSDGDVGIGSEIPAGKLDVDGHTELDNVNISGVVTATSFVGPVTGNVTGNTSGTAGGLTGSPSITVTDLTASGNVSIAGTLTYEDVTNVDSVGLITARSGIHVTGGNAFIGDNADRTSFLTPTANNLQIDGGVIFEPGSGNDVELYNYRTTAIKIGTGGTEKLRITSAGKVDVLGGYIGRNVSDSFTLNGVNQPHYGFQLNASSSVPIAMSGFYGIAFATNATERLRITSVGKVCINNDTALSDLHVCTAGSSEQDGTFRIGGSGVGVGLVLDYDQSGQTLSRIMANDTYTNSNALLKISVDGDLNTNQLVLKGDGKIGVNNTSPSVSVDLSENTDAVALPTGTTAQRPSGTDAYIRKNSTNNALEFYNGTNWVEIITDYFPTGSTTLG